MPTVNHPPAKKLSPAYGAVYRIIGGFLYAATSSLKRVIGRIFTIGTVSVSID
jgi:hypothetical protein